MLCRIFKLCTKKLLLRVAYVYILYECGCDVSLGEKDLKEDGTEQGTAELRETDVGLDVSSGDKKAEYKFVLLIALAGTWHCAHTIHTSFRVDSHCQGLILDLLVT